jgi:hypothetical protein
MNNQKFKISAILMIVFSALSFNPSFGQRDDGIRVRFNGFGDVTAGGVFGGNVDQSKYDLFRQYGEDPYPKGTHRGVGLQGLDFVNTVFLNDNFTVQSEVNLQVPRGGTGGPELDVERMYVDYRLNDKFGMQAGLIFTPIGFINRNLYSRAWLMNSVHMFRFVEEESGFVPNHFIGVTAYGTFGLNDRHSLKYIVGAGNARPASPTDNIYARNTNGQQITGLLEWIIQGPKDFRIGISGFTNKIDTYGGLNNFGDEVSTDPVDNNNITITESGFVPYVHYSGKIFEVLAEYNYIQYSGGGIAKSNISSLVAEVAFNAKINDKRFAPYIRYDYIKMPANNGPYVGLRDLGNGNFGKVYEADLSAVMLGISYDVSSFNRIKLEYARYFDGPYKENAIVLQTAFGF